jgi:predicted nucleotidyltransferase
MPELRVKFGVKQIGLFGSFIRGEGVATSDIDLLVEFSDPIGWEFIDLKDLLESALGREVDLVTRDALKPRLRDQILAEVAYA